MGKPKGHERGRLLVVRARRTLTRLRQLSQKFGSRSDQLFAALGAFLVAGVVLRLWHFASGSSLWLDEAYVATSIINRNWAGLLQSLEYGQVAPIGWLLIEKAAFEVLGGVEYSLRFPQFILGLAALVMFWLMSRRILGPAGSVIAVALFSLSPHLVLYSANVKPYGVDAALSVVFLLFGVRYFVQKAVLTQFDFTALLIIGTAALACSFPAPFLLAGLGGPLFIREALSRRPFTAFAVATLGAVWLAVFICLHINFYRMDSPNVQTMASEWAGGFAPFPPLSKSAVKWYAETLFSMFKFVFGEATALTALVAAGVGAIAVARRNPWLGAAILSPFAIALAASSLHLYPFGGRLIIVFVPQLIFLVATGVDVAIASIRAPLIAANVALVALAFGSATSLWGEFTYYPAPFSREHIRPVLSEIAARREKSEPIYVDQGALPAFRIYQGRVGLADATVMEGRNTGGDLRCFLANIDFMRRHRRIWIVYTRTGQIMGQPEELALKYFAALTGREIFAIHSISVHAFLYEFDSNDAEHFTMLLRALPSSGPCS